MRITSDGRGSQAEWRLAPNLNFILADRFLDGRVGVVLVTSGPGMSNTVTGLLDAHSDAIPVLCISGQVATGVIGTQAFQECDAIGLSRPVTKWNHQLRDANKAATAVRQALHIAASGKPARYPTDPFIAAIATDSPAQLPEPTQRPVLDLNNATAVADTFCRAAAASRPPWPRSQRSQGWRTAASTATRTGPGGNTRRR